MCKKYYHEIIAALSLICLPFLAFSILLIVATVNFFNTTMAIIILVALMSIILWLLYNDDYNREGKMFKFLNKSLIQYLISIVPLTLTLLNFSYSLDKMNNNSIKENPNSLVISLLLSSSFGTLIIIHNIYKGKHQK